ncbi:restriction endonuclease subunit S [Planktothrix sp. FACHB-1355]|uniref:Restriction endonuclease subunit S n=1 Tax=Aerosakkonema funiforme FACHB-1375 TaxID=2949571 RepID=A0A926VBM4_9CYAN|nr:MULTISPECIES: restriction endonuclease subunit S [Oscillatoriales]MBD2180791.1 restriction endonuclease subunit S [Aerosakkonema funiforme FACHB-1375]MBD3562215.1 restriction endonuclease subunit S [Planktothrix sp. FACHB-1355]
MSIKTFLGDFELLTDAPNAVVKLREIILQLAVRGKLVPQYPNDEPVSILLERMKAEKEELILNRTIVRDTSLPPIQKSEIPFKPGGWQWERLGNLARFIDYRGKTPPKTESGIKLVTAKNVRMGFIKNEPEEYISEATYQDWMTRGFPKYGDILLTTEAPLGNVAQLIIEEKIALAQRIIDLQPFSDLFARYLLTVLMSPLLQNSLNKNATGMTAQGIKSARLKLILIPVPPLPEQKRIVAKVDRLLILCDEIEKRQQQRQESIVRMNESAVAQLLSSQNPDDFRQHWQRICNNFDLLYSIPETVPKLRQAILQLAVQGKLVRQDPNDEPADQLLKLIREDRINKETNPRIKNQIANEPNINGQYKLPDGWIWTTTLQVCYLILDGDHNPPKRVLSGIPHLTARNIINNRIELNGCTFISEEDFERVKKRYFPELGDVILTCVGTLGRTAIISENIIFSADRNLAILRPVAKFILPEYLQLILNGPEMQAYIASADGSTAQPHIYLKQIRSLMCPLPPFTEQKRIVAKVDRLMSLCDELEGKLKEVRSHSEKLMEVAAREVLAV